MPQPKQTPTWSRRPRRRSPRFCPIPPYPEADGGAPRSTVRLMHAIHPPHRPGGWTQTDTTDIMGG